MSEFIVSFDAIDWRRPWLAPFKVTGQQLIQSGDWLQAANQIARQQDLRTASGHCIVFVPQHSLAADVAYEAHIYGSGEVPTRDNLHDFFNTLAWLHFPHIKKTLNALHTASQMQAADTDGLNKSDSRVGIRGRARDAATLFDENAALFICSDEQVAEALRRHQWIHLLQRSPEKFFSKTAVILFGHALIEKLVRPYKAITAHVWIAIVEPDWFEQSDANRIDDLDRRVAATISRGFSSADFAHLPVLGVPGWWPQQDEDFYKDASVFRALRNQPATS